MKSLLLLLLCIGIFQNVSIYGNPVESESMHASLIPEARPNRLCTRDHICDHITPANWIIFARLFSQHSPKPSPFDLKDIRKHAETVPVKESDFRPDWWKWEDQSSQKFSSWWRRLLRWFDLRSRKRVQGGYAIYKPSWYQDRYKTVIWFHGNGESLYTMHDGLQQFSELYGFRVIMVEYAGYGELKQARATQRNVLASVHASIRHLVQNKIISLDENTFFFASSLGTGIALDVLYGLGQQKSLKSLGGVLLATPYSSLRDVGSTMLPKPLVHMLLPVYWDPLSLIKKIDAKVVIVGATKDKVIPFRQSCDLLKARENAKLPVVFKAIPFGHIDGYKAIYDIFFVFVYGSFYDSDSEECRDSSSRADASLPPPPAKKRS